MPRWWPPSRATRWPGRGRAASALATAAIGSFVAGTIATILLTFLAQPIADIAVKFTAADYAALMAIAFVTVATLLGPSPLKGRPAC